jgi:hypothetical protein
MFNMKAITITTLFIFGFNLFAGGGTGGGLTSGSYVEGVGTGGGLGSDSYIVGGGDGGGLGTDSYLAGNSAGGGLSLNFDNPLSINRLVNVESKRGIDLSKAVVVKIRNISDITTMSDDIITTEGLFKSSDLGKVIKVQGDSIKFDADAIKVYIKDIQMIDGHIIEFK